MLISMAWGKISNLTRMKRKIVYIREMEPDALVIIFPHWQSLKYRHVTAKIKEICKELIAAGANYVLGHGTHMYECDKKARDGAIVYSLGNFVFNLPGQYGKFDALPYSVISQLELKESGMGGELVVGITLFYQITKSVTSRRN